MVNYNLGKIYKLVDDITGLIYIGSTCKPTLANRLTGHKANYKRFLNGKYHFVTSFNILKNNRYDIVLIELVNCNSKDELHARERHYIELLECVNKIIPNRTQEELAENIKQYYQENKEKFTETNKQYRENNKEKIKEYYQENKQKIAEYKTQYYKDNKVKIAENKKIYQEKQKQIKKTEFK